MPPSPAAGELGRTITTAELGWDGDDIEAVSAISGLVLPWTAAGSLHVARVVTDAGGMERRIHLDSAFDRLGDTKP